LELAVTRFLSGDDDDAAAAAFTNCSSRRTELDAILSWELHRLGSENLKLGERSDEFAWRYLSGGP
jgi:hypothetical protein